MFLRRVSFVVFLAAAPACTTMPRGYSVGLESTSVAKKAVAADAMAARAVDEAPLLSLALAEDSAEVDSTPVAGVASTDDPRAARAEDEAPLFPLPFTPDFTRGGGWGFALGLGVEFENAYAGSDEYEFEVDPAVAIQWRKGNHLFSWEGLELSWTTRPADQWYFQVDLGLDGEREDSDSDDGRLDGLEDRDDEFTGTAEVRYAFDSEWRNYVGTRISAGDSDFGAVGFLFAGHRFGARHDGGGTEAFLFATFANSNNLNREFGVSPSESAASGLAPTDLRSGFRSAGLRLVDRRLVTDYMQVVTGFEFQHFGTKVQSSPIAREDYALELELAVVFHF